MAQSKHELFDDQLSEKAKLFKALGHPARLKILQFLAQSKSCITGDISDELPLGRTTVNQHLAELKKVGLIQGQIEGVKTLYCLDTIKFKQVRVSIIEFLDEVQINGGCC